MHKLLALVSTLVVLGPLVARAETAPHASPSGAKGAPYSEPLMRPDRDRAIQRAKRTLTDAHALLARETAKVTDEGIGFIRGRVDLGKPAFRNETVVYKTEPDGSRLHMGYLLEMNVTGAADAPWVPVALGRHGVLLNRIFVGDDSLFAKGVAKLPEGTLARAGAIDLDSSSPLDRRAVQLARRQERSLGGALPARIPAPTPPAEASATKAGAEAPLGPKP